MGILDDAIREHLELKRKHGVSEEELQRQQEEALGPARRDVAQQPDDAEISAEAAPAGAPEGGPATAVDEAPLFDGEQPDTPVAEAPPAAEHLPVAEEPAPAEPPAIDHEPAPAEPPVADHTGMESQPVEHAGPPAEETDHEPESDDSLGDTEPHGFPAVEDDEEHDEGEELPESDPELEDVLEDTPDFLQETPEHDRLWFEQKPPRDFDFD